MVEAAGFASKSTVPLSGSLDFSACSCILSASLLKLSSASFTRDSAGCDLFSIVGFSSIAASWAVEIAESYPIPIVKLNLRFCGLQNAAEPL
ncbi:MAG TPA: hypothetical protein PLR25_13245, partial [Planctomycetaceae bacterium]|nr:hypothetical protein [Planctomycetaceae bacterium]